MLSHHAEVRCQQRSIPIEAIDALLTYGEQRRRGRADVYYLSRRARDRVARALGSDYRRLEKALDSYLVVADNGEVITAAHRHNRLKFK